MRKRISREEILNRFSKVHGTRYDYSRTFPKKVSDKVTIICKVHGDFEQLVQAHLRGANCPECSYITAARKHKYKINNQEIIDKCKETHGDLYDYSRVNVKAAKEKITIICREHGEFKQYCHHHILGDGCPVCAKAKRAKSNTHSLRQFLKKAREIHGDKYDYSKSVFTRYNDKIIIICKKHGGFEQRASDHTRGKGCPKCGIEKSARSQSLTTDQFIEQSKAIHGDKYDYSKAVYKNQKIPITIICEKHGPFKQRPTAHVRGAGCPACANTIKKQNMYGGINPYINCKTTLYYIKINHQGKDYFKIGLTKESVLRRYKYEQMDYDTLFEKVYEKGSRAYTLEQNILEKTCHLGVEGYRTSGIIPSGGGSSELRTECILDLIKREIKYEENNL